MVLLLLMLLLLLLLFFSTGTPTTKNVRRTMKTGETWSIFNVLNWNWAVFSWELHVQYDSAVRSYGSTQRQSLKRAFVFESSPWSNTIWSLQCIILLALWSLYCSADWIGMLTITSATIPCNSVLLYCIFMLYCKILHCQNGIWVFFNLCVITNSFYVFTVQNSTCELG